MFHYACYKNELYYHMIQFNLDIVNHEDITQSYPSLQTAKHALNSKSLAKFCVIFDDKFTLNKQNQP